jgi:hypothetical protein
MPDDEDRKDRESEIGYDGQGTVYAGDNYDSSKWQTVSIRPRSPEIRHGVTLEQSDEKERNTTERGKEHGCIDDPVVDLVGRYSEEENSDGAL